MHEFAVRMYVLRMWHEPTAGPGEGVWRASLLNPRDRRRRYFSDLTRLAAYLEALDPAWPDEETDLAAKTERIANEQPSTEPISVEGEE